MIEVVHFNRLVERLDIIGVAKKYQDDEDRNQEIIDRLVKSRGSLLQMTCFFRTKESEKERKEIRKLVKGMGLSSSMLRIFEHMYSNVVKMMVHVGQLDQKSLMYFSTMREMEKIIINYIPVLYELVEKYYSQNVEPKRGYLFRKNKSPEEQIRLRIKKQIEEFGL